MSESLLPKICGEWEMDLTTSEPLGPLLRELGLNRVLAAVVARVSVKQTISVSDKALNVVVKTALSEDTLMLPFDGSCVSVPGITGGQSAAVSRWLDEDRTQYETRQSLNADDDDAAKLETDAFVTVRSLREGGAVLVESCSLLRDGVELAQPRCERVLRRLIS